MGVIGSIFEDMPEGANAQWLVSWNRERLLTANVDSGEPHVAASLPCDGVAELSKPFGQIIAVEIPGDSHKVNISCRT